MTDTIETPPSKSVAAKARENLRRVADEKKQRDQDRGLALDMLRGADEIAHFLFGDEAGRRKVYHLFQSKASPPHFRLGAIPCARKSALLAWIAEQEARRP
jgi:hypothetical protein